MEKQQEAKEVKKGIDFKKGLMILAGVGVAVFLIYKFFPSVKSALPKK